MKKFLTVLLVIAVMFTFSFGSAFATVPWTGEKTNAYLTEAKDYTSPDGEEGITEAYRAQLTKEAKAELKFVKSGYTAENGTKTEAPFYAPEKAEAVALIEAYIESLKTVKTAKDADDLKGALAKKVGKFTAGSGNTAPKLETVANTTPLETKATLRTAAVGTNGTAKGSDSEIVLTRVLARATSGSEEDLYLPGWARYNKNAYVTGTAAGNTSAKVLQINTTDATTASGTPKTQIKDIFAAYTPGTEAAVVIDWFLDNNYRKASDFAEGAKAFANSLKLVDTVYETSVKAEFEPIQKEIWDYEDKAAFNPRKGLGISELEGLNALVKKINDFEDKYAGYGKPFQMTSFKTDITGTTKDNASLAVNYFDQYYTEVSAVPAVNKLTDADKATVVALYKKVMALEDAYTDVWDYAGGSAAKYAWDFDKLDKAYNHFLEKDIKAFDELAKFDELTADKSAPITTVVGGTPTTTYKAYFDTSEKNVNAMKAQRTAYDALVSSYGYSKLAGKSFDAIANEAKLLAGEHNQGADADYDVKDTKTLQNYLNNATLKVTTSALGNTKIRVQARFDTDTYEKIVAECGNDYTISYKFYHKTAKATAFKGPKEKSRNYITYTKASLKKGTKYKFQCGVVIKDAQGKVVAEKSYKASTTGSRVCR